MTATVRIGLSGWNYREWKDDFYHGVPQRAWLQHAAETFPTLEVNATFYRSMKASTYEKWHDATPAGFRFSLKGSRYVTHYGSLEDSRDSVLRMRDDSAPLGDKVAAAIWQTPAKLEADADALARFLDILAEWEGPAHAIEFRNPDWFTDRTAALLDEAGVANTISDAADWPRWDAVTGGLAYLRLHGHTRTYISAYAEETLRAWAQAIDAWCAEGTDVLVYFDNTDGGAAPKDALRLIELVEG